MTSHQTIRLSRGRHAEPAKGACAMELASMLAGERFGDQPESVCPVIAAVARAYNDRVDDERRQDLRPVASASVGTRSAPAVEVERLRTVERWTRERLPRWRLLRRGMVSLSARAGDYEGIAALAAHAAGRGEAGHRAMLDLFERLAALEGPPAPGFCLRAAGNDVPNDVEPEEGARWQARADRSPGPRTRTTTSSGSPSSA